MPSAGTIPGAPFLIMNGFQPDAAGLNGTFLVANILQETAQIKTTQAVIVSGAGAPAGTPFKISRAFNAWPRVAAFAGRWLLVWEGHANHDDSPGTITGSFVETTGSFGAPFTVGNNGNDRTPHLAVGGTQALVVWSTDDIYARRINADGTSPDTVSGMPVAAVPSTLQALPSVAWDGQQYVVTWVDQRNEPFPQLPRGDIYAARVAQTNVKFEEFVVANSSLPEDSPFVVSSNGLTVFSYAKSHPQAPYAAHRTTTRTARLDAPPAVPPPPAPTSLSATQVNDGTGTVTLTWGDPSMNEEGFKLEMKSGTGAFSQIRLLAANTTSTTVSNVSTTSPTVFRLRAYNAAGDSDYSNEASAPAVVLTRFSPNTYNEPATVQIAATASDPEGVARVEFYSSTDGVNYSLLATDADAPYGYQWANVPRGYYYVKAKAYDATGASTLSLYDSFVVYGNPTATITLPANGAVYPTGSSVTINATAQTSNSNEYLLRMDFYANSTLVGTVQGHYESYQFNWANPPAGNYQLTARPTSSLGLTGSSAPVNVTVGNPGSNISGRITDGTNPIYGVRLALSGSQTAQATTDADGYYFFTNVAAGGSYTVTPSASGYTFSPASLTFNNVVASQTANFTGTPGAPVAVDANATPIYSQASDSRSVEGPASKVPTGQQMDQEVADDFELVAQIARVRVGGTRGGYNMPPNPVYYGVYVRFYDGASGTPGAQQAEYFLPKDAPGVSFDAANPSTFDITLPSPFNATGRHFVSVQPVFGGSESWWVTSGGYPNVRGATLVKRDRLANGAWTVAGIEGYRSDLALSLYGTLLSAPRIDSVSPNPVTRSGLVRITGAYFGASQSAGQLTVDGKQSPYVVSWADNLIVAYVPESTTLGNVSVRVTNSAGAGSATLNVTTRQADGRIRWRFTVAGDYVLHRSGVGPDGTVYLNDVNGRLYALSPDGGLKWVFKAGFVGYVGPVTVGADGTVYVAGLVPRDPATPCQSNTIVNVDGVFAINPDGTQKWLFDKTCQGIIAGPNVGPDGKIYAVSDALGIGAFALNPDGSLAYAVDRFGEHGPLGEEIVFGPTAPGLPPTQQYFQFDNGSLFGYTLQGQRVFSYPTVKGGQPAAGLRTGSVYTVGFPIGAGYRLFSITPQGA
ncbi:MAG: carboxypeptidase regulatory-like domain-containing protein, partial [Acidobacteria bacterium]|nr:carboxypeptidase regulatory-like domain-containing protein [Acidobacteriota bacterium]